MMKLNCIQVKEKAQLPSPSPLAPRIMPGPDGATLMGTRLYVLLGGTAAT